MAAMASSAEYAAVGLPKLKTSKDIRRRDSLSSSRTRDSGYNSDLEASVSPLEFVVPDHDIRFSPLRSKQGVFGVRQPALWKKGVHLGQPFPGQRRRITSQPASLGTRTAVGLDAIGTFKFRTAKTAPFEGTDNSSKDQLKLQDQEIEKWIIDNLPSRNRPEQRVSSIVSLSSTSSCDMYSATDISDEDMDGEPSPTRPLLPLSTCKAIDLVVRKIELNLRYAACRQRTLGNDRPRTQSRAGAGSQDRGSKSSQGSGQKRKSRVEGSPPPNDDDEDGSSKRRRASTTTTTDGSEVGAKFACPFYKHDPDRYRHRRTCPGPGWPTVHRMKEHLYRSHSQPIFCPICYSTFKSDKEQLNHIRLQQCQRSGPQQIEGLDRETIWILRKRTTALRLEEDRWRDVYHVLFPEVPLGDIPSPFYDCDSPSETSRRFRRDLLRRVQEELFTTAGQASGPNERQLLGQVADIIRRCENELLHPAAAPMAVASPVDRRVSHSSSASAGSMISSPRPARPAREPDRKRPLGPSALLPLPQAGGLDSEGQQYGLAAVPHVDSDPMQYVMESAVEFAPIIWDEPTYGAYGTGLDWDAIFPTAPDASVGGNETFSTMAAGMYT